MKGLVSKAPAKRDKHFLGITLYHSWPKLCVVFLKEISTNVALTCLLSLCGLPLVTWCHSIHYFARYYENHRSVEWDQVTDSLPRPCPARFQSTSRGGAVVRALASLQCGPGSIPGPGVICGLSLLLVLSKRAEWASEPFVHSN